MSDQRDPGPRLSRRLAYLLKRAFFELERLHEQHLTPVGVDARELALLLFLDGRDPSSQQDAARRLGVDRTTMVELIDGLEHKGLVARLADPSDRRRNVIDLTGAGRAMLRDATRASDDAERALLADLGDEEAAQLRLLLQRIVANRP